MNILKRRLRTKMGIKTKPQIEIWNIEYATHGSLDFPCDFCGKRSYQDNFQIKRNRQIELIVCEDCLNKCKTQKTTNK